MERKKAKQEKERIPNLKHVTPLNLSLVTSTDSRKHLPLLACGCDNDCDHICGLYG